MNRNNKYTNNRNLSIMVGRLSHTITQTPSNFKDIGAYARMETRSNEEIKEAYIKANKNRKTKVKPSLPKMPWD